MEREAKAMVVASLPRWLFSLGLFGRNGWIQPVYLEETLTHDSRATFPQRILYTRMFETKLMKRNSMKEGASSLNGSVTAQYIFMPTAYVRRASFCGPHIPHIPVTAQNNCPYLGCDTHLPANLLSFFTYFPPIRMRWKWWKTRNLSVVSLTWLVMDSVKLDSALSLTVFSLTRRCLGQCLAWLSAVHDSVKLDSALSMTVFSLTQSCPVSM